ncbi:biotin-dependent carboxyltransferase family protein [Leuconostoc gelidum]|uniref:5-oxoprolinase subunit C family protein n=1 Tax=Leuconostoc gelidum TaxID=1244 RepID=UPI001C7DE5AB|nr:biotin-dependent carboxyltransferase family protein [Leuconostoc gelidum]MBZ6010832.1 biotin-dependent carboxyltransferase family protein [Leuconostoc gelidum subsp. aenigmaticum]
MNTLKILTSGIFSTIQDSGRIGYQGEGFLNSGVMDLFAYQIGNALVGNALIDNPASIEFGITGGKIRFSSHTIVSVTGARVVLRLNDNEIDQDVPIIVKKNDVLDFTKMTKGRFVYLSIAGGIQVPTIMNSHSTSLAVNLGGFEGRKLENGDVLPIFDLSQVFHQNVTKLTPKMSKEIFSLANSDKIRVVNGPEFDWFSETEWRKLLQKTFYLGKHINRMGFRIDGPMINFKPENLLSEANMNGAIQVSRDGHPIILLADRATHGGYPVIAKVISSDLGLLSQWPQNKPIYFEKVSVTDAWAISIQQADIIKNIYQTQPWQTLLPTRVMANKIKQLF